MMRKLGDVMRVFAWCLVVAGLVIGSISVSYATYETTTREAVWIRREWSTERRASPSTDPFPNPFAGRRG